MTKVMYPFLIASFFLQGQSCLASARDHFNYDLKDGHRVVYQGQTNDLKRREMEHRQDKKFTHMIKKGHAKTEAGALKAEKAGLATYRKSHGGQNPKYNQTKHG